MPRGRPPTDLAATLEGTKRQFFYLVYILKKPLVEVKRIFDSVFEEMAKTIGIRIQVSLSQWQARKDKWDHEWNFGPGCSGPTESVLKKLDELPLWYDGMTDGFNLPLGNIALDLRPTASLYHKRREGDAHCIQSADKSRSSLEESIQSEGIPKTLPSTRTSSTSQGLLPIPTLEFSHDGCTSMTIYDLFNGESPFNYDNCQLFPTNTKEFETEAQPTSHYSRWLSGSSSMQ